MNIVYVWDSTYVSMGDWNKPDWISINDTDNSFSILLDKVQSIGTQNIKLLATFVQVNLFYIYQLIQMISKLL